MQPNMRIISDVQDLKTAFSLSQHDGFWGNILSFATELQWMGLL